MKFLHLGDLHLGKSLLDYDLIEDQRYILNQIIDVAVEREVDAVLIAGDIYDKSIPPEAAVNLLDDFINRLVDNKLKVFIISGNHDSDVRLNFGSAMFEDKGVYIASKYNGTLKKHVLKGDEGNVNIYCMPFVKASTVRHFYPDEVIENYEDAVRVIIKNSDVNSNEINILLAHQFVCGKSEDIIFAGSEGMGTINVGLVEQIGYDCFDDFNYVALGHIHSTQKVGRDEVRYSGSPLKYSLSEANHDKYVPLVNIDAVGKVAIENILLSPLRNLRHIKGKLSVLLDKKNITDEDDYIYATLTDEEPVGDACAIFRQFYPNTVRVDYDNAHSREMANVDFSDITRDKSFDELIGEFYSKMYGCDISSEEMKVMHEVAGEAGVIIEAD